MALVVSEEMASAPRGHYELLDYIDPPVNTSDLESDEWQPHCPGADNWFDRSICPDPCDMMHTRCTECGSAIDYCVFEDTKRRPDWDEYFLGIATAVATRADCTRRKVGAVVVKDRRIRGTGYNGAPAGEPGCSTCPRRDSGVEPGSSYDTGAGACVAIHAEANALLYCDREDLLGADLYLTTNPCDGCLKLIKAAGIKRVVWPDGEING